MTEEYDSKIFERVEDCFCRLFGEQHKGNLTLETSMDDVVEWDSLSYIDFVCELEDEFEIEFSETESAQMFQVQHILRIISSIINHQPHDDVEHAYAQMRLIQQHANDDCLQVIILSGSSTREGFLPLSEMQAIADQEFKQQKVTFYNVSVSGLVIAEMLQIIESLKHIENLRFVIGFSPIILFGCGMNEFSRSCDFERFALEAPRMQNILKDFGYEKSSTAAPHTIEQWCQRYLADKSLEALRYSPYKYPTLKPWDSEKLQEEESILRYYNNAPLNFSQSEQINTQLLDEIFSLTRVYQNKTLLLNLTLHSGTLTFLEELGELVTATNNYIKEQESKGTIAFLDSVAAAQIEDEDYRDPGHIYRKQHEYTLESIRLIRKALIEPS